MTSHAAHDFSSLSPAAARVPDTPPADVLHEVEVAWTTYDRLERAGRHLHFNLDQHTGRLTIELLDLADRALETVSPRRLLAIAAGELPA